jgi:hypothetical protein
MKQVGIFTLVLSTLFIASAAAGTGGGTVKNATPRFDGVPALDETQANAGYTASFSGVVFDGNGEQDIETIQFTLSGGSGTLVSVPYAVDADDLAVGPKHAAADQTTSGAAIWVWNQVARDGKLNFAVTYTFNYAGTFTWTANIIDDNGKSPASPAQATIEILQGILVRETLVLLNGQDAPAGSAWGSWSYLPGEDTEILGQNFVQVTNNGFNDQQGFSIHFSDEAFYPADGRSGPFGSDELVPIHGHVVFGFVEVSEITDLGTQLANIAWATGPSANGLFNGAFSGAGNHVFVTYKLVNPPAILVDQPYTADVTVEPATAGPA